MKHSTTLASLLGIAGAPVIDLNAPLPIAVTPEGKRLARRVRDAERIIADLPAAPVACPPCTFDPFCETDCPSVPEWTKADSGRRNAEERRGFSS